MDIQLGSLTRDIEDEEGDDLDDTDEDFELNKAFVSALFDEIDDLRIQVRILCSIISTSVHRSVAAIRSTHALRHH